MDPPKEGSACGIPDCSTVDVGRGRPCSGLSSVRACRGSVEASAGTLPS